MGYSIKNGKIVGKTKSGKNASFPQENVDLVISSCRSGGLTTKYLIAAVLATVAKESLFVPKNENLNYSESGLLKIFPSKFGPKKANAKDFARKPEKIANWVYDKSRNATHTQPGDGWKYRGRGFNQITFKDAYKKFGKMIGEDLLSDPDKLNQAKYAADTCVAFYVDNFKTYKRKIKTKFGQDPLDIQDYDKALLLIINLTAGFGFSTKSNVVQYNYGKAKEYHPFLIEYLEQKPEDDTQTDPSQSPDSDNNTDSVNNDDNEANENEETSKSSDSSDGFVPVILKQFSKPTIRPTEISLPTVGRIYNDLEKKNISKGIATAPFVYYNGVQISPNDILNLSLYHEGILPAISLTFNDSAGVLGDRGFPLDNTVITIYINSKSQLLRSVYMDFKISKFRDLGGGDYHINGICNIPQIYLKKFKSYSKMTSYEAYQEIARECELGFCSNIDNTNDKMTWINPGLPRHQFVDEIIKNSYYSDSGFLYVYIDYYYNLCYVEVEKELERDISEDKMVNGMGSHEITGSNESDEKIVNLILTTNESAKGTNAYIDHYTVNNRSTEISLNKSYLMKTKYYDSNKKEVLIFDVDSISSSGAETIVMKGNPGDSDYYRENVSTIWLGKLDRFNEDGSGNAHLNYNYSYVQNTQNLDDLTKISATFKLSTPNFNLYKFQKVYISLLDSSKRGLLRSSLTHKRLEGDWLIINNNIKSENGELYQELVAIKRELSMDEGESEEMKDRIKSEEPSVSESFDDNQNELTPQEKEEVSDGLTQEEETIEETDEEDFYGDSFEQDVDVVEETPIQNIQPPKEDPPKEDPDVLFRGKNKIDGKTYYFKLGNLGPKKFVKVYTEDNTFVYDGSPSFTADVSVLVETEIVALSQGYLIEEAWEIIYRK